MAHRAAVSGNREMAAGRRLRWPDRATGKFRLQWTAKGCFARSGAANGNEPRLTERERGFGHWRADAALALRDREAGWVRGLRR